MINEYQKYYIAYNIYSKYWDIYIECQECNTTYWNILDQNIKDIPKHLEEFKGKKCYRCNNTKEGIILYE